VEEPILATLAAWESFYVIVGSSAAALTGLQFVVMALLAESQRRSSMGELSAFGIGYPASALLWASVARPVLPTQL
jgi:hypothetical protein